MNPEFTSQNPEVAAGAKRFAPAKSFEQFTQLEETSKLLEAYWAKILASGF